MSGFVFFKVADHMPLTINGIIALFTCRFLFCKIFLSLTDLSTEFNRKQLVLFINVNLSLQIRKSGKKQF